MIKIDKEQLVKVFIERLGFSEEDARRKISKLRLENINPKLQASLDLWLEENKISDFEANGVTFQDIKEKWGGNFIDSLFTMSYLMEDPEAAKHFKETTFYHDSLV